MDCATPVVIAFGRMDNFRIAVKSFVVNGAYELLLIKRRPNDPHKPGVWEIPGGRLELGEDPFEGLRRETQEETGLEVVVRNPLRVHHFTRDDGQRITMITFYCTPNSRDVQLSDEHTDYRWSTFEEAYGLIHPAFKEEIDIYRKHFHPK